MTENSYQAPILNYPVNPYFSSSSDWEKDFLSKSVERKKIEKAFDFDQADVSLEEVAVQGKRIVEQSSGPRIYGDGSVKVKVADNPALENQQHPLDLVKGRVAGVQVSGAGLTWKVLIQGVGSINSSVEPLIMLDDIPIRLESLHTIPVQEIESFTVWKGPDTAVFGARGANGAIGFYTKRGREQLSTPVSEIVNQVPSGYQIEREFYSPKYGVDMIEPIKPDRRVTLFWAPNIRTDSSGKASVQFYNHDMTTVIQGEIEGLSANGNPGHARFEYSIVKF